MIEMAIIAMIVSSVTLRVAGNVAVDGFFAARGMESPRLAGARKRRPRGAASRYWGEVWDDAWTGASAKRAARRASPGSPSRPRGAATSFWADWLQDQRRATGRAWDRGWTRLDEKRREKASRPRPGQVTVPGTVVPNAQDGDGPEPRIVPDGDGGTDLRFGDDPNDPTGVRSCPKCRGAVLVDGEICPSCRGRQERRNQHHDNQQIPAGTCARCGRDALVDPISGSPYNICIACWKKENGYTAEAPESTPDSDQTSEPTTPKGPTMTMTIPTDTEVVSLNKAIDYSESTARVAKEMVNSIDFTENNLAAGGVTGIAIESFASAKESFGTIAAAMEAAALEFKAHLAIQEARVANPGAGSDEFIMGHR